MGRRALVLVKDFGKGLRPGRGDGSGTIDSRGAAVIRAFRDRVPRDARWPDERFSRYVLLRPSTRPPNALLHRDVGAVQLLRDARDPAPIHDRRGDCGRHGPLRRGGRRDLRCLHRGRLHGCDTRRLRGRSPARPETRGVRGRCSDRTRAFLSGFRYQGDLLPGPSLHRRRYGPAEAEHQRHRGHAVQPRGSEARRGFFDLLHGHQHRRLHLAPGLRVAGPERFVQGNPPLDRSEPRARLALGIRRRGHRDDRRRHSIRPRGQPAHGNPGRSSRCPTRPFSGRSSPPRARSWSGSSTACGTIATGWS